MPGTPTNSSIRSAVGVVAMVCVVVLLLGGAYVGGYYIQSSAFDKVWVSGSTSVTRRHRMFQSDWEIALWRSMVRIESLAIGQPVEASTGVVLDVESTAPPTGGVTLTARPILRPIHRADEAPDATGGGPPDAE